jgi:hypothetical protein
MDHFKRLAKRSVFPLMIGVSLMAGRLIPTFYDWTESDQSRLSPLVPQTAVGLFLFGIIACFVLPWVHFEHEPSATSRGGTVQFTIRSILATIAVIAVFLAAFRKTPMLAVSGGLHAVAMCYVVRFWTLHRSLRWPVASLLACMYFPFAWIVSSSAPFHLSDSLQCFGLPAIFFVILLGGLVHHHPDSLAWLSIPLTSAELLVGVWLISLGPRRSIACLVFVLIASLFGSFVLNALLRA